MSKSNTERNYWIAVIVLLIVVWFLGSWDFYVCEVRGFCPNEAVVSEDDASTQTTQSVQSASIVGAFESREVVEEEVPVAERPVRYYRNY